MLEGYQHDETLKQLRALSQSQSSKSAKRLYSADRFLVRLKPHLASFGITRIADVTGLDRLRVPVVQAVRPLALSNAVNQGKGLTLAEAAVSSIMEALETLFSEAALPGEVVVATPKEIYGTAATEFLKQHLPTDVPESWRDQPIEFVEGVDLVTGAKTHVPAALVSTDYTPGSVHAETPFERTTTGLGGGATQEEALIHALYETLERLGTARAMRMHGFFERFRIAEDYVADSATNELFDRLDRTRMLHAVYECPSIGGYPVIWVRLLDANQSPTSLPFHADGFACRRTIAEATRAALLEAIQTRAAVIAGGREDITWRYYPKRWDEQVLAFERAQIRQKAEGRPQTHAAATETVSSLANAVTSTGLRPIALPIAANTAIPLHIVRVVTLAETGPATR